MNPFLSWFVRPYIRTELPGWGRVYSRFVGDYRSDGSWTGQGTRTIRGKFHGYEMDLDLSRWSERATYFLGRFYDLEMQLLLKRVLRPGDRFVDIGANIGMVSLLASRLVGADGIVDSFEPNPKCADRVRSTIRKNSIENIRLHQLALADVDNQMRLTVPLHNSGEGTLTQLEPNEGAELKAESFDVTVRVGDEILASDPRPPILIKIDVEGFEYQTLAGLTRTLKQHGPGVITEVVSEHLARAGRSPSDLFKLMADYGYGGYSLHLRRRGLSQVLAAQPASSSHPTANVLWVPASGPARIRLQGLLA